MKSLSEFINESLIVERKIDFKKHSSETHNALKNAIKWKRWSTNVYDGPNKEALKVFNDKLEEFFDDPKTVMQLYFDDKLEAYLNGDAWTEWVGKDFDVKDFEDFKKFWDKNNKKFIQYNFNKDSLAHRSMAS